jgi:glycosyltransferase involved in cell wall biosynthesis
MAETPNTIRFEHAETPGLVSIIIPAHRAERFIGETLDGVERQTYRSWEVIVVEDGSRDGTEKIVDQFARRCRPHRVAFRRNDCNCGPAHARNVGFSQARGQYIAMLDADDRWLNDHLELSIDALKSYDRDIVFSTALIVEDQTEFVLGTWGPNVHEIGFFQQSLMCRNLVPTSTAVMRRQVVADVGPWNIACRYCDDFEFWLRCAAALKRFHFLGGCRCLYRKNHNGAVTERWCSTWEESAMLTERFKDLPGTLRKRSRKYASNSYELAARLHATTNPEKDPSADPSRAAGLMLKAWRLRRRRISFLLRAARYRMVDLLRHRRGRAPVQAAAAPDAKPLQLQKKAA